MGRPGAAGEPEPPAKPGKELLHPVRTRRHRGRSRASRESRQAQRHGWRRSGRRTAGAAPGSRASVTRTGTSEERVGGPSRGWPPDSGASEEWRRGQSPWGRPAGPGSGSSWGSAGGLAGSEGRVFSADVSAQPDRGSHGRREHRHCQARHPSFREAAEGDPTARGLRGGALGRGQQVVPVCSVRRPHRAAPTGLMDRSAAHGSRLRTRVRAAPWCAHGCLLSVLCGMWQPAEGALGCPDKDANPIVSAPSS